MKEAPPHPGAILEDVLKEKNISQSELARLSEIGFQRINGIVRGRRSVTMDSALRIERVLGVPAESLVHSQASYDLHAARKGMNNTLKKIKPAA